MCELHTTTTRPPAPTSIFNLYVIFLSVDSCVPHWGGEVEKGGGGKAQKEWSVIGWVKKEWLVRLGEGRVEQGPEKGRGLGYWWGRNSMPHRAQKNPTPLQFLKREASCLAPNDKISLRTLEATEPMIPYKEWFSTLLPKQFRRKKKSFMNSYLFNIFWYLMISWEIWHPTTVNTISPPPGLRFIF